MKKPNKKVPEHFQQFNTPKKVPAHGGWKAKLLMALMGLLTAMLGFAEEQWAEVIRVLDTPQSDGSVSTRIMLDRYDNGRTGNPDMSILITNTDREMFSLLLKEALPVGSVISYDDRELPAINGFPTLHRVGIMSINDVDILDIFPDFANIFIYAARKRAQAATPTQRTR